MNSRAPLSDDTPTSEEPAIKLDELKTENCERPNLPGLINPTFKVCHEFDCQIFCATNRF